MYYTMFALLLLITRYVTLYRDQRLQFPTKFLRSFCVHYNDHCCLYVKRRNMQKCAKYTMYIYQWQFSINIPICQMKSIEGTESICDICCSLPHLTVLIKRELKVATEQSDINFAFKRQVSFQTSLLLKFPWYLAEDRLKFLQYL